jgi:hypothetical protein
MKKLLMLLALIFFPMSVQAGGPSKSAWFCRVVGNMNGAQKMFITYTWTDKLPNHYEAREMQFIKHVVKTTKGEFRPSFQAKCRDYTDAKRAEKHRLLEVKTAKEYKFDVSTLNWRWVPDAKK